jgi:hypothetical protein
MGIRTLSFLAGQGSCEPRLFEITHAIFTNNTTEGPLDQGIYLEQGTMVLDTTQTALGNFHGKVKHESPLACTNIKNDCESKKEV